MTDNLQEQRERLKQVLNLRELYHGRFTQEEIDALLVDNDWNDDEVISFIQENEPATVRQAVQRLTEGEIQTIQSDPDIARSLADGIRSSTRLFSCQDCDRFWWRKVPSRKEVSKCHRCHVKYDPVPRDKEWGWAVYSCQCGNEFSGHGCYDVGSQCYKCRSIAYPTEIRPPSKRRGRRSRQQHSCNAPDCDGFRSHQADNRNTGTGGGGEIVYNRTSAGQNQTVNGHVAQVGDHGVTSGQHQGGQNRQSGADGVEVVYNRDTPSTNQGGNMAAGGDHVGAPGRYQGGHNGHLGGVAGHVCVSPQSRRGRPKVIYASSRHVSSGSTVDTFLDQDDLCSLDSYVSSLPVIPEQ